MTIVCRATFQLGLVDAKSPKRKEALEAYFMEMERALDFPQLDYAYLVRRRVEANQLDKALKDIEKGLVVTLSQSQELLEMKAIILHIKRNFSGALEAVERALQFNPNHQNCLKIKSFVLL